MRKRESESMSRLSVFDAGFLMFETGAMPMHVGGLQLFTPPDGQSPEAFVRDAMARARQVTDYRAPFDQKPVNHLGRWRWAPDEQFDIDYHLRHSALPLPGRYREMFALVSRLHGSLLDRSRPLWEMTLIEGLEIRQVAMYTKVHHSVVDGLGAMKLLRAMTSENPAERDIPLPFEQRTPARKRSRRKAAAPRVSKGALTDFGNQLQSQFGVAQGATHALGKYLKATIKPQSTALVGFAQGPKSVINQKVYPARRVVAQSYSIERIHRLANAYNGTINDIVLAMSSASLRTHLYMHHVLPEKPLVAMAPVGLKTGGSADDAVGNAVGMILINLATNIGDPVERLQAIRASVAEAKSMLRSMNQQEILAVAAMAATPWALLTMLGLYDKVDPSANVVISNVPGPKNPLYWNGARMDGMYPISIVTHGMALNYTITSYAGSLDFGITACRRSVPKAQRLIDYLEQGLVELEQAAGLPAWEAAA